MHGQLSDEEANRKLTSYDIPEDAQSMAAVQDNDRAFIFGFKTHREVFSELGYLMVPESDHNLGACSKTICDMLYMNAVMKAMTITAEDLIAALPEDEQDDSMVNRNAAMVLTGIRQAVTNYAGNKQGQQPQQ